MWFIFLAVFEFLYVSFFPVGEHLETNVNIYHLLRCIRWAILKSFCIFRGMPYSTVHNALSHVEFWGTCSPKSESHCYFASYSLSSNITFVRPQHKTKMHSNSVKQCIERFGAWNNSGRSDNGHVHNSSTNSDSYQPLSFSITMRRHRGGTPWPP